MPESDSTFLPGPGERSRLPVAPGADLVAEFLAGRSASTVRAYGGDLRRFAGFVGAGSVGAAAHHLLTGTAGGANRLVLAWRASMTERGLSPATVNRGLSSVRALVRFARLVGVVGWTVEVGNVRGEAYRDTRGPGLPALRMLLSHVEGEATDARGLRNQAIVRLLWNPALRSGEVISLDVGDVDLEGGRVSVVRKGRREREWKTLPPATAAPVGEWIAARGGDAALFQTMPRSRTVRFGERMTTRDVSRLLARLGKSSGAGRVRPDGLRHASISALLDWGARRGTLRGSAATGTSAWWPATTTTARTSAAGSPKAWTSR